MNLKVFASQSVSAAVKQPWFYPPLTFRPLSENITATTASRFAGLKPPASDREAWLP